MHLIAFQRLFDLFKCLGNLILFMGKIFFVSSASFRNNNEILYSITENKQQMPVLCI